MAQVLTVLTDGVNAGRRLPRGIISQMRLLRDAVSGKRDAEGKCLAVWEGKEVSPDDCTGQIHRPTLGAFTFHVHSTCLEQWKLPQTHRRCSCVCVCVRPHSKGNSRSCAVVRMKCKNRCLWFYQASMGNASCPKSVLSPSWQCQCQQVWNRCGKNSNCGTTHPNGNCLQVYSLSLRTTPNSSSSGKFVGIQSEACPLWHLNAVTVSCSRKPHYSLFLKWIRWSRYLSQVNRVARGPEGFSGDRTLKVRNVRHAQRRSHPIGGSWLGMRGWLPPHVTWASSRMSMYSSGPGSLRKRGQRSWVPHCNTCKVAADFKRAALDVSGDIGLTAGTPVSSWISFWVTVPMAGKGHRILWFWPAGHQGWFRLHYYVLGQGLYPPLVLFCSAHTVALRSSKWKSWTAMSPGAHSPDTTGHLAFSPVNNPSKPRHCSICAMFKKWFPLHST